MDQNLATKSDIEVLKTDLGIIRADVAKIKSEMLVLKWMVGLVIAAEVLPLLRLLFA